MYFEYLAERQPDKQVIEHEDGFAIFSYMDFGHSKAAYIEDIYVKPDKRQSGVASELSESIQNIAKRNDCLYLLGSVIPSCKGSTASLKVLLAHGMSLLKSEQDIIWFFKEL